MMEEQKNENTGAESQDTPQVSSGEDVTMEDLDTLVSRFPQELSAYSVRTEDLDYIGHCLWLHYDRAREYDMYKHWQAERDSSVMFAQDPVEYVRMTEPKYESILYRRSDWEAIAIRLLKTFAVFPVESGNNRQLPRFCPIGDLAGAIEMQLGNHKSVEAIEEFIAKDDVRRLYQYFSVSLAKDIVFVPFIILDKIRERNLANPVREDASDSPESDKNCCGKCKCGKKGDDATEE